jgi:hypothetical protein
LILVRLFAIRAVVSWISNGRQITVCGLFALLLSVLADAGQMGEARRHATSRAVAYQRLSHLVKPLFQTEVLFCFPRIALHPNLSAEMLTNVIEFDRHHCLISHPLVAFTACPSSSPCCTH